jgi:hypothetical protein
MVTRESGGQTKALLAARSARPRLVRLDLIYFFNRGHGNTECSSSGDS